MVGPIPRGPWGLLVVMVWFKWIIGVRTASYCAVVECIPGCIS